MPLKKRFNNVHQKHKLFNDVKVVKERGHPFQLSGLNTGYVKIIYRLYRNIQCQTGDDGFEPLI